MKRTILFITSLVLIVGCSKSVEDSTLINKDGLMYLPDSDSPYSGEVFTNYSSGEKEYQGTYENGLLIQYSYLNKDGTVKEPVNGETLIDRGGLLYEVNGQKPYTGDVFELYEDGSRKMTGSLKGGKYNGLNIGWYENGQKEGEVTFKDGKLDGLVTWWYENGQKNIEGTYKNNKEDGLITNWYENGQKWKEETYKDGKLDGLVTWWYENGQKNIEGTYKNNKEDGLITNWYENGQKWKEETYKDGKEDGLWTWWYENGRKFKEKDYINDTDTDIWTYIDKDGSRYKGKENEWTYNGGFLTWYDNENTIIRSHGTYKDGELDGLLTYWYENGQKKFEGTYKDVVLISPICWDEDGNECECGEIYWEGCK
uniref:Uncharacterized protein conserved in bacteria n=1 Tax=uncultured Fidelibacterota bacterium HF0500_01L02 TaxID=710790 RepID=E0XY05_9BACT|nr:uncharacterized protein conserved in bacteria [uncultured Marinimicrobia bacterium HF0500_01L02]